MNDFLRVQVFHRLADLFHEAGTRTLCQHEVFVNDSLEQLAALYSVKNNVLSPIDSGDDSLQLHEAIKFISEVESIVNLNDC